MKKLLIILLLFPLFTMAQTAKTLKASNGQTIGFYESIPEGNKKPVIIFLHGWDEKGNGTTDLPLVKKHGLLSIMANAKDFIILAPQLAKGESFWPLWYVDEMVKYAVEKLNADPSQMILTGLSLGASTVIWYGYSKPSVFAALVPMAAPCYYGKPEDTKTITAPVWAFVGDKDELVNPWCTQVLKEHVKNILITVYPGGDHGSSWIKGYAEPGLYSWMRLQRKNVPAPIPERKVEWIPIGGVPVLDSNNNLINGTYQVELRVTAGDIVSRDTVSVTIADSAYNTECNILPTVDAGPDQEVKAGITFTLNATGTDIDGTMKRWKWKRISGPLRGKISYSTRQKTTVTNSQPGVYVFEVTGYDDNDGAGSDRVTVVAK